MHKTILVFNYLISKEENSEKFMCESETLKNLKLNRFFDQTVYELCQHEIDTLVIETVELLIKLQTDL